MDKVFVVTILDYYTDCASMFPDGEILGVGASMSIAMKMAEDRLEKSGVRYPSWYTSPTEQWAHTDTVSEPLGAEIRAYNVKEE